ncbi:MAG: TonB-dependent receptor [Cyclobacteriaceae bacterium]|nr:TonB-dependent receptor [Cyclobacteriaceae bacterium]
MKKRLLITSILLITTLSLMAQEKIVSGTVTEQSTGSPLPGVNVSVKGTSTGTQTDASGQFRLSVPSSINSLTFSSVGYKLQDVSIPASGVITVAMEEQVNELAEIVVSVGRGSNRTITDTPLPIDNFSAEELKTSGQVSFDKALQYRVPSFNTVNTPVNDATSLFDPYEIRNLGPSRTLILINGKRKNLTSLVYTQTGPGRGETGADLSAIPTDAIKRVEILRDGASAQYGSDAIAGVMNIILKDRYDATSVSLTTGSTLNYGGLSYGLNYNSGANFGNKGFINYHMSFNREEAAIRKDKIDAVSDARDLTGDGDTPANIAIVQSYLQKFPDGNNKNGTPDNTSSKFLVNGAIPVGENSEVYFNAAYVFRKTVSNANFRQPYWRIDHGLLHKTDASQPDYTTNTYGGGVQAEFDVDKAAGLYKGYIGYQPSFEGDLSDYNGTIGFRSQDVGGWKQDMSLTVGGNKMLFTVNNTVNRSLRANSPISFKPGGFSFNHLVGNMDFSKAVRENFFVAFGSEFRSESWELIAGDTASYSGDGANSFPGFQQRNAIKATRYNIGVYADLTWDITDNFLIGGTIRSEKYSDFGAANVYKITSRYKVGETFTIRGAVSSGFRAPTLHQQYLSLSQASFSGGDIVITGLANNYSREASLLGVPRLKAEKSQNVSFGFGFNPNKNLSITADYYSINISDRIVYGSEVSNALVDNISFFVNAAETKTTGLDVVASYRTTMGLSKLSVNLAGNYRIKNELVGGWQAVNNKIGLPIYNQTSESLLTTSRPKYKYILGGDLMKGKLGINLNNTLFGPTQFNNADLSSDLKLEFLPKVLTDLGISYDLNPKTSLSITVQNLLNIMPEFELKALNAAGQAILNDEGQVKEQISYITFNGRYPVLSYDGSHFSQMGTTFLAKFTFQF